jgi:hypothetical protein
MSVDKVIQFYIKKLKKIVIKNNIFQRKGQANYFGLAIVHLYITKIYKTNENGTLNTSNNQGKMLRNGLISVYF